MHAQYVHILTLNLLTFPFLPQDRTTITSINMICICSKPVANYTISIILHNHEKVLSEQVLRAPSPRNYSPMHLISFSKYVLEEVQFQLNYVFY